MFYILFLQPPFPSLDQEFPRSVFVCECVCVWVCVCVCVYVSVCVRMCCGADSRERAEKQEVLGHQSVQNRGEWVVGAAANLCYLKPCHFSHCTIWKRSIKEIMPRQISGRVRPSAGMERRKRWSVGSRARDQGVEIMKLSTGVCKLQVQGAPSHSVSLLRQAGAFPKHGRLKWLILWEF